MIGTVSKLIIFTSMVKRIINTSKSKRVILQVYGTCLQMFLFFGLRRKDCLTRSTLSSDTSNRPALFPLQRHPVFWNCWYQRLMLLGDRGSLLNCCRNACWTETTDSCLTNYSTQNAFCFRVAIIILLCHRPREKSGVGLRMRTKLEHLLFHSMWETYFRVHFESYKCGFKPFQSFWYMHYYLPHYLEMTSLCSGWSSPGEMTHWSQGWVGSVACLHTVEKRVLPIMGFECSHQLLM
jgi:hypothetical protein